MHHAAHWEYPEAREARPWEGEGYRPEGPDFDDEWDPVANPHAAAAAFVGVLVEQHLSGVISAQVFCVLCWWAHKAGVQGAVEQYGVRPGCYSGHYQPSGGGEVPATI